MADKEINDLTSGGGVRDGDIVHAVRGGNSRKVTLTEKGFAKVRVAATGNVNISTGLENGDTIDGVTLATGDLVLLPSQTTAAECGIYTVAASGAASRAPDFETYNQCAGSYVSVSEGTTYADTLWRCTSNRGGTLGTTALVFERAFSPVAGFRNKLINGDGWINQRSATTAADDAYAHDRHYALTQTASIGISTLTAPASGLRSMMRLTQSQATAQRMGYAQIVEASETYGMRGKLVTLGGKLRYSNAAAVRYALLEWTGTADAPTSDVVNNWASGTYTGGNFFISTSINVLAVGSITPAAATITDWALTATIGSSANNIIVLFWTEGTAAQSSTLDMRWYLVEGDVKGDTDPFSPRHIQQELALCQRYYETGQWVVYAAVSGAGGLVSIYAKFAVQKRAVPTLATTIIFIASGQSIRTGGLEGVTRESVYGYAVSSTGSAIDANGTYAATSEL